MSTASIHLLGVEWIGNDSVAAELGSVVGPLIVAAVAIYAARLAARTANERQERQLTHDGERQERQLEKEGERQREQLNHDREMRQREHARDAVDDAIEQVSETQALIGEVRGAVQWREARREGSRPDEDRSDALEAALAKADETIREKNILVGEEILSLYNAAIRLRLRLGMDHEIPVKLLLLQSAWRVIQEGVSKAVKEDEPVDLDQLEENLREANECFAGLMIACEKWFQ